MTSLKGEEDKILLLLKGEGVIRQRWICLWHERLRLIKSFLSYKKMKPTCPDNRDAPLNRKKFNGAGKGA